MIKVLFCRHEQCLGPFTMLLVEGSSTTGLFIHLCNNVICRPESRKYISYEAHLFFQNVQKLMLISKMLKKIPRKVFVS